MPITIFVSNLERMNMTDSMGDPLWPNVLLAVSRWDTWLKIRTLLEALKITNTSSREDAKMTCSPGILQHVRMHQNGTHKENQKQPGVRKIWLLLIMEITAPSKVSTLEQFSISKRIVSGRYSEEPVDYKKSWLNDESAGLEMTEDQRLTCFSEHVVSETSIQDSFYFALIMQHNWSDA